jgi:hypothetical protein
MTKEEFDKLPENSEFYISLIPYIDEIEYGPFRCSKLIDVSTVRDGGRDRFTLTNKFITLEYAFLTFEEAKQDLIIEFEMERDKWQKRIDKLQLETILE